MSFDLSLKLGLGTRVKGGGGPVPVPPPVIISPPVIDPDSGVIGDLFTAIQSVIENATYVGREWFLNSISIGTGPTVTPEEEGSLVLVEYYTGDDGKPYEFSSGPVNVTPSFEIYGTPVDAWANVPYQPPIYGFTPNISGSPVLPVSYSFIGDLVSYGFSLNSATGALTSSNVVRNSPELSGHLMATDGSGQSVSLPIFLTIKNQTAQFLDNMGNQIGATEPVLNRISPDSGYLWGSNRGTGLITISTDNRLQFTSTANTFGFIQGWEASSESYEVLCGLRNNRVAAVDGQRLGALASASSDGLTRYDLTWHVDGTGAMKLSKWVGGVESHTEATAGPGDKYKNWPLNTAYTFLLKIDRTVVGQVSLSVIDLDENETVLSWVDTDPIPHSFSFGVGQVTGVAGTANKMQITTLQAADLNQTYVRTPGSTYFVDPVSGDDNNDGLSQETAWKNPPGDALATGKSAAFPPLPGDVINLKGGNTYQDLNTFYGGSAGAPVKYIGDAWGGKRARITSGVNITSGLRTPLSQEDAGGFSGWQNPNVRVADLADCIEGRVPVLFGSGGGYDVSCYPENWSYNYAEDVDNTSQWLVDSDLPSRETPNVGGVYPNLIITDAALSNRYANMTGVRAWLRDGFNEVYSRPMNVSGNQITIDRSNQQATVGYTSVGDSRFRVAFLNDPEQLVEGSVCNLGGKILVWLREGEGDVWFVPHNPNPPTSSHKADWKLHSHLVLEGFTVQGLPDTSIFEMENMQDIRMKRMFIADGFATATGNRRVLKSNGASSFGIEDSTFTRMSGWDHIKLNNTTGAFYRRIVSDRAGAMLVNDNVGGTTDAVIEDVIGTDMVSAHGNAITLYGNGSPVDNVKIDRVAMLGGARTLTMQGSVSNVAITNSLFVGDENQTAGAVLWYNGTTDEHYCENISIENCAVFGSYIGLMLRKSTSEVSLKENYIYGPKESIHLVEPKDGGVDRTSTWVSSGNNTSATFSDFENLSGLSLTTRSASWVDIASNEITIDLSGNPDDE